MVEAITTITGFNQLLDDFWEIFSVITQYLEFSFTFTLFRFMFQLRRPPNQMG